VRAAEAAGDFGPRRRHTDRRTAGLVALALLLACAPPLVRGARASTEEFSTFDVERADDDDETFLDLTLLRTPYDWTDAWQRSDQGFKTSQGCLTSGQWAIASDLRVRAPIGQKSHFGVDYHQVENDMEQWSTFDLSFLFPQRVGTLGAFFRPLYDKSRQDFGMFVEAGHDTAAAVMRATFTVEDMFNNLWAWRQTRVGDASASYLRHPYEPALELGVRRARWRTRVYGKYLTPSIKDFTDVTGVARQTLWGTVGTAELEGEALGATWNTAFTTKQARSSDERLSPPPPSPGDNSNFRRLWNAEAGVRGRLPWRIEALARTIYMERTETWAPPTPVGRYDSIERLFQVDLRRAFATRWTFRVGGMFDRATVVRTGITPWRPNQTRNESRPYFGFEASFGAIRVYGIEGIELDPEKYDVWLVHDKGFLGLQARF
jgi:hypothetical protein